MGEDGRENCSSPKQRYEVEFCGFVAHLFDGFVYIFERLTNTSFDKYNFSLSHL